MLTYPSSTSFVSCRCQLELATPRQDHDAMLEVKLDSLSYITQFGPKVQLDDLLRYPKLLSVDNEIFILHGRPDRFIGYDSDVSVVE